MYIIYHIIHELIKYQSNCNYHRRHFLSCQNYMKTQECLFFNTLGFVIVMLNSRAVLFPLGATHFYLKQICLSLL